MYTVENVRQEVISYKEYENDLQTQQMRTFNETN